MKRLTKKTYFIYGLGVSYFMLDQLYVQWLSYFYTPPVDSSLKAIMSARYIMAAFIIIRLVDAIADPLVGYLSDNTESRFGRRSIFMLLGGLPLSISMILYFFPVVSSELASFIYFTLIGSIYFIAYTLVGGPYNSLVADLSENDEESVNLSTAQSVFRLVFTAIPMMLSGKMIEYFKDRFNSELLGFRMTVIIFSVLAALGVYACALFLGENKLSVRKKSKEKNNFFDTAKKILDKDLIIYYIAFFLFFSGFNLIRALVSFYVKIILKLDHSYNTIFSVALFATAAIFFPITNILSKKLGFKKTISLNLLSIIVGTLGLIFFRHSNVNTILLFCVIIGTGISGAAFIFPPAMLSSLSAKITRQKGISAEGFLFGLQGFVLKLAFMVQTFVLQISFYITNDNALNINATYKGVILALVFSVVLFALSLTFYIIKKDDK